MTDAERKRFAGKAPFPFFGGKSKAAPLVWSLLGDPAHYVEPFCGSCAVLLNRPHPCNRHYFSETVNDADGLLVNAWRAMQMHPDATAEAASWPVSEADKIARQIACLKWQKEHELEHVMGDPLWCDPLVAGWWLYGVACQIGAFSGDGPWTADPATGRIYKQPAQRAGREPGVSRDLPFLSANAAGMNHASLREPGVSRDLPYLANDGRGTNNPVLRERGVGHFSDTQLDYHPMTMPKLREWFALLSARLRHVRIVNGDWHRVCTHGALYTLSVGKQGAAGVFLDPPYANAVRSAGLYALDSGDVAVECRAWCLEHGTDPDLRVVLAGYDTEHPELVEAGWREYEWFKGGFLTGGMGNVAGSGKHQQHRERLWASPGCLEPQAGGPGQRALFGEQKGG